MPRILYSLLIALSISGPALAQSTQGQRTPSAAPAAQRSATLAARHHFDLKKTEVKARTIGLSKDGKESLVVVSARDRATGQVTIWKLNVDRASNQVTQALRGLEHDAKQNAQWSEANRLPDGAPAEFIQAGSGDATGKGLGELTRSHKNVRVGVPGRNGTPTRNVLFPARGSFLGEGSRSARPYSGGTIQEDPADGVPVSKVPDRSPWFLPHRRAHPNPRPPEVKPAQAEAAPAAAPTTPEIPWTDGF